MRHSTLARILIGISAFGVAGFQAPAYAQDASAFFPTGGFVAFEAVPLPKPAPKGAVFLFGKNRAPIGEMNCEPVARHGSHYRLGSANPSFLEHSFGYVNAPRLGPSVPSDLGFPILFHDPGVCVFMKQALTNRKYKDGVAFLFTPRISENGVPTGVFTEVGPATPTAPVVVPPSKPANPAGQSGTAAPVK